MIAPRGGFFARDNRWAVENEGVAPDVFVGQTAAINRIVHDSVARFRGSISAEHGLGQLKREEILRYKSSLEVDLMRKIKRALDPNGIMNPGCSDRARR